jgi:hypothetical protein
VSVYRLETDPDQKAIIATCRGCVWRDHAVRVSYFTEVAPDDVRTVSLDFLIHPQANPLVRLWRAIRYVFGARMVGWYGVELTRTNARTVGEFLVWFADH